jgi:hypothetical protein
MRTARDNMNLLGEQFEKKGEADNEILNLVINNNYYYSSTAICWALAVLPVS